MKTYKQIHFKRGSDFRDWLKINHNKSDGIWMIFYKKHINKQNITYNEAVEEALCFGWIDSTIKRINDETYVYKFTPRTNIKNWSDSNKIRVLKLIKQDKMTEAGLNKIDLYLKTGKVDWKIEPKIKTPKPTLETPDFITDFFLKHEPALTNFNNLAPSHKKNYVLWISDAKREETITKRLNEAAELLKQNKKLGMK